VWGDGTYFDIALESGQSEQRVTAELIRPCERLKGSNCKVKIEIAVNRSNDLEILWAMLYDTAWLKDSDVHVKLAAKKFGGHRGRLQRSTLC
jgi:hypothetical protein